MSRHLSARMRLTLLYTTLFAGCGAVLVTVTYALLSSNLRSTTTSSVNTSSPKVRAAVEQCVANATGKGDTSGDAKARCATLYAKGVSAGSTAQRNSALSHLLLYSLLTFGGVIVLAAATGWFLAGRILRPVHQITAAARCASEQNLSERLNLAGPRDELRELADTFDQMLDRLDAAFTSQRHFIANASHELRTPLTVMRTSLDVVLAKPRPTEEELRSMADEMRIAVDHAERLIDALLTLARNQQPRSVNEPLDLAVVTEDALDRQKSPNLTVIAALDAAPVAGDPVLLERLVGNLLDNAERYNVPGGTIEVSTSCANGSAVLRVANTGPQVDPADVPRLFEPFTRLEDRTRHDGFGLGLALVRSITAAHGGTIHANAGPAGGLDLKIVLPRRP